MAISNSSFGALCSLAKFQRTLPPPGPPLCPPFGFGSPRSALSTSILAENEEVGERSNNLRRFGSRTLRSGLRRTRPMIWSTASVICASPIFFATPSSAKNSEPFLEKKLIKFGLNKCSVESSQFAKFLKKNFARNLVVRFALFRGQSSIFKGRP